MSLPLIQFQKPRVEKTCRTGWLLEDAGTRYVVKRTDDLTEAAPAVALHHLYHPGLPRCLGQTLWPETDPCLVFEHLDGQTLDQWLQKQERTPESLRQLLSLTVGWAGLLSFLHQEAPQAMIHGDIKPANLLVSPDGQARLIDFGSARLLTDTSRPVEAGQTTTLSYAAPERITGEGQGASDLYALALTLLACLSGQPVQDCRHKPLQALLPDCDVRLVSLLQESLSSDSDQRPASARLFASRLQALVDEPGLIWPVAGLERHVILQEPQKATDIKNPSIRSPFLCVWGSAAFACELAAVLGETRTVLVFDANLLEPAADLLLGVDRASRKDPDACSDPVDWLACASDDAFLSADQLRQQTRQTSVSQVRLLQPHQPVFDYEYGRLDRFAQTVQAASKLTETLVLSCNQSIFDAYTCYSLLTADRILVPLKADLLSLRSYNRSVTYLSHYYGLQTDRLHVICFEYNPSLDLSRGTINQLCHDRLSGCITEAARRRSAGQTGPPYASRLSEQNKKEYRHIIKNLALNKPSGKEDRHACCAVQNLDDRSPQEDLSDRPMDKTVGRERRGDG